MFPTISNSLLNATIWASVFSALALAAPASISMGKRDYNPGWCGLHLTQFQKASYTYSTPTPFPTTLSPITSLPASDTGNYF